MIAVWGGIALGKHRLFSRQASLGSISPPPQQRHVLPKNLPNAKQTGETQVNGIPTGW
jgi:hypothetical protein